MSLVVSNKYLPGKYELALTVNRAKPNFEGTLTFPLQTNHHFSGQESEFKLILNSYGLVILEAKLGNKPLLVSVDSDKQTIVLQGKESISVEDVKEDSVVSIKYLGKIHQLKNGDQTRGVFKLSGDNTISTQTQPVFAREIYPSVDDLNIKVPMKVCITTNSGAVVVTNSMLESKEKIDDMETFIFRWTPPILGSNFAFTIGDLAFVEDEIDSIPIRVYCSESKRDDSKTELILSIIKKLLPLMSKELGAYPLDKLDVVGVPYLLEGAMENWGAITVMEGYLYNSNKLQLQQLISHELIHQWIGNCISFNSWKYMWLNESMATFLGNYFVTLINEQYNMTEELMTINSKLLTLKELNIQKFMNKLVIDNNITVDYLFNHLVYEKGIMILRMMVNLLSETTDDFTNFLAGLNSFINEKKFTTISANEIWQHLSYLYNADLLSFTNIWMRYDKYPVLQINIDGSGDKLTINQNQSQIYVIPLVIKTVSSDIKLVIKDKLTEIDFPPELLIINKNKIAFTRLEITKKIINQVNVDKLTKLDCQNYLIDYPTGGFNKTLQQRMSSMK